MEQEKLPRGLWRTDDGRIAMDRCPKCDRENYAFNVLSGICTWCGYNANDDYPVEELLQGEK